MIDIEQLGPGFYWATYVESDKPEPVEVLADHNDSEILSVERVGFLDEYDVTAFDFHAKIESPKGT